MELKHNTQETLYVILLVLIVPYGIETSVSSMKEEPWEVC